MSIFAFRTEFIGSQNHWALKACSLTRRFAVQVVNPIGVRQLHANTDRMARTYLGAFIEMIQREFASRFHRDLVLELETGPATSSELTQIIGQLRNEFPSLTTVAAGGDSERSWKISVRVRPNGAADALRKGLLQWASTNEPFVRKYSVRQMSLWRTA